jgi:arsenate reductase
MAKVQIIHKPACSTSRSALQILEENGVEHEVILYLTKKLSYKKIESLIAKLGIHPTELIRKKEALYQEIFAGKNLTDAGWIQVLADYPELIERPVIIKGRKAIIARPLDKIAGFLQLKVNQPK